MSAIWTAGPPVSVVCCLKRSMVVFLTSLVSGIIYLFSGLYYSEMARGILDMTVYFEMHGFQSRRDIQHEIDGGGADGEDADEEKTQHQGAKGPSHKDFHEDTHDHKRREEDT